MCIEREKEGGFFFGVKIVAMNSHRIPVKGRGMGSIMGQTFLVEEM